MDALIGIGMLIGIAVISVMLGNARTTARKATNASVRRSLEVRSALAATELTALMSSCLAHAGSTRVGSFDNKSFFRLSKEIQLELTVSAEGNGSHARVALPTVRSTSGRPQRLAPVGRALDAAARMIRENDRTATIA